MATFSDQHISIASIQDATTISSLLNKSYRGESSKKGWTTEADLIEGEVRATVDHINDVMGIKGSVFLKYVNESGALIGCLNLQMKERGLYLGMFSVDPDSQGGGIGKKLLNAAEEYAHQIGCGLIHMWVISKRTELISWYNRNGYAQTDEIIPFQEDSMSGKHKVKLEFIVLEKHLK